MKWYVCTASFNEPIFLKDLSERLAGSVSSASNRKGALQSLCQLLKSSPLSQDEKAPVELEMKGRTVNRLTRKPQSVNPLVILFGLYVMAERTQRDTFTVRPRNSIERLSPCWQYSECRWMNSSRSVRAWRVRAYPIIKFSNTTMPIILIIERSRKIYRR